MLSSLRLRLIFFVLIAVLPVLGLTLYTTVEGKRRESARVREDVLRLARIVALQEKQLIDGTRQLLVAMAEILVVRNGDPAACNTLFANLLKQYRRYANLGAIKPDGEVFCSALPLPGYINVADRAYFRRTLESRNFAIGDFQVGRITGKPTIDFAYPVLDDAGHVRSVVFAALDLTWLSKLEFEVEAQMPPGSTFTKIDPDGIVIAHYPDPDKWVGRPAPEASLFHIIQTQAWGIVEEIDPDGIPRLYAFTQIHSKLLDKTMYVIIGVSKEVVFADIKRILLQNLVGLGIIAILALVAAWFWGDLFILRKVNSLVGTTRRLSAGDLGARSGPPYGSGELGLLAHSFDEMAEALQTRQNMVEQTVAALRESEERYRELFENANDIVYTHDLSGNFTAVNMAGEQLTGYTRDEILTMNISQLVMAQYSVLARQMVEQKVAGIGPTTYELEIATKDGRRILLEVATRLICQHGKIVGVQGIARDITERKRSEQQIQRQLQRLAALREVDMAITASLDLDNTLNVLLNQVTLQLNVDAADVLLFNKQTEILEYTAGCGFLTQSLKHVRLRLGEGHAGQAVLKRCLVSIPNLTVNAGAFQRASLLMAEGFVAYHGVPLVAKKQIKGVLEVFHRVPFYPDKEWLNFLEALAVQAAIAIDNAELFNEQQQSNRELIRAYDTTIEGWSRALDLRDKETEGHCQRVTEMSLHLARVMGISEDELVHVRRGALLHDIGKIGVPDNILLKPGPLTEEEWDIMRRHPIYAYDGGGIGSNLHFSIIRILLCFQVYIVKPLREIAAEKVSVMIQVFRKDKLIIFHGISPWLTRTTNDRGWTG